MQKCIDRKSGFTGLAIADDKLTLASSDRNKAVDRFITGLERAVNGFSFDNAVSFFLNLAIFFGEYRTFAVNWLSKSVYDSTDHGFANRNGNDFSGAADFITLNDFAVVAEKYAAYVVFLKVLDHSVNLAGEFDKLACHCVVKSMNPCDTVADLNNCSELGSCKAAFIISDLFFDQFVDFIGSEIH